MKRIIINLILILLLTGCTEKIDSNLKDYDEIISEDNRQNLVIYLDGDGVFDQYTIASLLEHSLADMDYGEITEVNGVSTDEIEKKITSINRQFVKDLRFIFNYQYVNDNSIILDESDLRLIIDSDNVRFYVYHNGYLKILSDDNKQIYYTNDSRFNSGIDAVYKTLDSMTNYYDQIHFGKSLD